MTQKSGPSTRFADEDGGETSAGRATGGAGGAVQNRRFGQPTQQPWPADKSVEGRQSGGNGAISLMRRCRRSTGFISDALVEDAALRVRARRAVIPPRCASPADSPVGGRGGFTRGLPPDSAAREVIEAAGRRPERVAFFAITGSLARTPGPGAAERRTSRVTSPPGWRIVRERPGSPVICCVWATPTAAAQAGRICSSPRQPLFWSTR